LSGSDNYILPNSLQFQLNKATFVFFLSNLSCKLLLVQNSPGTQMSNFRGKGRYIDIFSDYFPNENEVFILGPHSKVQVKI